MVNAKKKHNTIYFDINQTTKDIPVFFAHFCSTIPDYAIRDMNILNWRITFGKPVLALSNIQRLDSIYSTEKHTY